jgi:hypothetical protein
MAARGRFAIAVSGGHTPWIMLRALAVEDIPWESVHVVGNVRREFPTDNLCKTFDSLRPSKGASGKVCASSALCVLWVGFGGGKCAP